MDGPVQSARFLAMFGGRRRHGAHRVLTSCTFLYFGACGSVRTPLSRHEIGRKGFNSPHHVDDLLAFGWGWHSRRGPVLIKLKYPAFISTHLMSGVVRVGDSSFQSRPGRSSFSQAFTPWVRDLVRLKSYNQVRAWLEFLIHDLPNTPGHHLSKPPLRPRLTTSTWKVIKKRLSESGLDDQWIKLLTNLAKSHRMF